MLDSRFRDLWESREIALGVDLGTTNTVAAASLTTQNASPQLVQFAVEENPNRLRSIVHIGEVSAGDGRLLVGRWALDKAASDGDFGGLVTNFKGDLGCVNERRKQLRSQYERWFSGSAPWDPEDSAAAVLRLVRDRALLQIRESGGSANVDSVRAVIGIPAKASQAYRQALKHAAEICGLTAVLLVAEPVAACWAYHHALLRSAGFKARRNPLRVLVVDVGAGTTDLSVVDLSGEELRVIVSNGDTQCGGTPVDHEILKYVLESSPDVDPEEIRNWEKVREAKERANARPTRASMNNWEDTLSLRRKGGRSIGVSLTGQEMHGCAKRVAARLARPLESLLIDGLKISGDADRPIEKVVLVGGGCQCYAFQEEVERLVKQPALKTFFKTNTANQASGEHATWDIYGAVARGLALIAQAPPSVLFEATKMYASRRVVDPVGLSVVSDETGELLPLGVLRNDVHLDRFTEMASRAGEWEFYGVDRRARGKQTRSVSLRVLAGDGCWIESGELIRDGRLATARCLGEFSFDLKYPRLAEHVHIRVRYDLDESGVISVWAQDWGAEELSLAPEDSPRKFVLEFEQLGTKEIKAKTSRLKAFRVSAQFGDGAGSLDV